MWKKILILLGVFSAIVLIVSIYLLTSVSNQFKVANYLEASKIANISLSLIEPISKITFAKNNEIELLRHSLNLVKNLPLYSNSLTATNNVLNIRNLNNTLKKIDNKIQVINNLVKKSLVAKK